MKKTKKIGFNQCCAKEIRRLWIDNGGCMNILHYASSCPQCKHFIGLTQTNTKDANEFLSKYKLEPIK